jgi:glutaminyl-tRNA synthetase
LAELVDLKLVNGWDDPRMPTIAGMRRRGYTPQSIRDFCQRIGITKKENSIEMGVLENSVREDLDHNAPRVMAVLRPLKITLVNWPEGKTELLNAQNHPNRPEFGDRQISFGRELYIEQDDFMENPPRKFFRLQPGGEVRLRYGYIIKCEEVIKDAAGNVTELKCSYDPETRSGAETVQRKVKGTIHWVSSAHAIRAECRLYDRLFNIPRPDQDKNDKDFKEFLNPDSFVLIKDACIEPAALEYKNQALQFERTGYFVADTDSAAGKPVFNRVVSLRDSWAKLEKQSD